MYLIIHIGKKKNSGLNLDLFTIPTTLNYYRQSHSIHNTNTHTHKHTHTHTNNLWLLSLPCALKIYFAMLILYFFLKYKFMCMFMYIFLYCALLCIPTCSIWIRELLTARLILWSHWELRERMMKVVLNICRGGGW